MKAVVGTSILSARKELEEPFSFQCQLIIVLLMHIMHPESKVALALH